MGGREPLRPGAEKPLAVLCAALAKRLNCKGSSAGGRVFPTVGASYLNSRVTPFFEGRTRRSVRTRCWYCRALNSGAKRSALTCGVTEERQTLVHRNRKESSHNPSTQDLSSGSGKRTTEKEGNVNREQDSSGGRAPVLASNSEDKPAG